MVLLIKSTKVVAHGLLPKTKLGLPLRKLGKQATRMAERHMLDELNECLNTGHKSILKKSHNDLNSHF